MTEAHGLYADHHRDGDAHEHVDWKRCIELYDRPTTFFFLDPPYTECKVKMYSGWTNADVQELRERLRAIRGKWLVTINDTPATRAIFQDCEILPIERAKGINARAVDPIYRELIITPKCEVA